MSSLEENMEDMLNISVDVPAEPVKPAGPKTDINTDGVIDVNDDALVDSGDDFGFNEGIEFL